MNNLSSFQPKLLDFRGTYPLSEHFLHHSKLNPELPTNIRSDVGGWEMARQTQALAREFDTLLDQNADAVIPPLKVQENPLEPLCPSSLEALTSHLWVRLVPVAFNSSALRVFFYRDGFQVELAQVAQLSGLSAWSAPEGQAWVGGLTEFGQLLIWRLTWEPQRLSDAPVLCQRATPLGSAEPLVVHPFEAFQVSPFEGALCNSPQGFGHCVGPPGETLLLRGIAKDQASTVPKAGVHPLIKDPHLCWVKTGILFLMFDHYLDVYQAGAHQIHLKTRMDLGATWVPRLLQPAGLTLVALISHQEIRLMDQEILEVVESYVFDPIWPVSVSITPEKVFFLGDATLYGGRRGQQTPLTQILTLNGGSPKLAQTEPLLMVLEDGHFQIYQLVPNNWTWGGLSLHWVSLASWAVEPQATPNFEEILQVDGGLQVYQKEDSTWNPVVSYFGEPHGDLRVATSKSGTFGLIQRGNSLELWDLNGAPFFKSRSPRIFDLTRINAFLTAYDGEDHLEVPPFFCVFSCLFTKSIEERLREPLQSQECLAVWDLAHNRCFRLRSTPEAHPLLVSNFLTPGGESYALLQELSTLCRLNFQELTPVENSNPDRLDVKAHLVELPDLGAVDVVSSSFTRSHLIFLIRSDQCWILRVFRRVIVQPKKGQKKGSLGSSKLYTQREALESLREIELPDLGNPQTTEYRLCFPDQTVEDPVYPWLLLYSPDQIFLYELSPKSAVFQQSWPMSPGVKCLGVQLTEDRRQLGVFTSTELRANTFEHQLWLYKPLTASKLPLLSMRGEALHQAALFWDTLQNRVWVQWNHRFQGLELGLVEYDRYNLRLKSPQMGVSALMDMNDLFVVISNGRTLYIRCLMGNVPVERFIHLERVQALVLWGCHLFLMANQTLVILHLPKMSVVAERRLEMMAEEVCFKVVRSPREGPSSVAEGVKLVVLTQLRAYRLVWTSSGVDLVSQVHHPLCQGWQGVLLPCGTLALVGADRLYILGWEAPTFRELLTHHLDPSLRSDPGFERAGYVLGLASRQLEANVLHLFTMDKVWLPHDYQSESLEIVYHTVNLLAFPPAFEFQGSQFLTYYGPSHDQRPKVFQVLNHVYVPPNLASWIFPFLTFRNAAVSPRVAEVRAWTYWCSTEALWLVTQTRQHFQYRFFPIDEELNSLNVQSAFFWFQADQLIDLLEKPGEDDLEVSPISARPPLASYILNTSLAHTGYTLLHRLVASEALKTTELTQIYQLTTAYAWEYDVFGRCLMDIAYMQYRLRLEKQSYNPLRTRIFTHERPLRPFSEDVDRLILLAWKLTACDPQIHFKYSSIEPLLSVPEFAWEMAPWFGDYLDRQVSLALDPVKQDVYFSNYSLGLALDQTGQFVAIETGAQGCRSSTRFSSSSLTLPEPHRVEIYVLRAYGFAGPNTEHLLTIIIRLIDLEPGRVLDSPSLFGVHRWIWRFGGPLWYWAFVRKTEYLVFLFLLTLQYFLSSISPMKGWTEVAAAQIILGFLGVIILYDYILHEILFHVEFTRKYWFNRWVVLEWTSYLAFWIAAFIQILTFSRFPDKSLNAYLAICITLSSLCWWLNLYFYMRAFRTTSLLVIMLLRSIRDSRALLFLMFFVTTVGAILIQICENLFELDSDYTMRPYFNVVWAAWRLYHASWFGEYDLFDFSDNIISTVFFGVQLVFFGIFCMNILIAIIDNSVESVRNAEAYWSYQTQSGLYREYLNEQQSHICLPPSPITLLARLIARATLGLYPHNRISGDSPAYWKPFLIFLKRPLCI